MKTFHYSTHLFYLINRLLCSPLEALFTLLIFILSKDAGATPLQLAVLAASKPLVSLIAFYANLNIVDKEYRIKPYLALMTMIGCFPCFFFPFFHNPWYYVMAFALYTTTSRASFPAWVEILKSNVGVNKMSRLVSKGTSINYATVLFLPIAFSFWMDQDAHAWKSIFCALAVLQMMNIILILFLKIAPRNSQNTILQIPRFSLMAFKKDIFCILKENPPFTKYLLMFFLGGAGIVAMQSILPIYFKENLHLSYKQLTLAFSFCKGISFLATSPIWANYVNHISLYRLNFFMNGLTCLFIICVLASGYYTEWLFMGYIMYGMMQAGCELSWNMSGPVFSREKESTLYSSLNLVLVGVRGCICPFMGQSIFLCAGVEAVFTTAFLLSFIGLMYALWLDSIYKKSAICQI